jgi:TDG/mug DNA glycosylase family protein
MIRYRYRRPKLLFVGINPHFGSFQRGVPFSNNKMFWYLLAAAGVIGESRETLSDDAALKRVYQACFTPAYGLGFINVVQRPTRDITEIRRGEELPGRRQIERIIRQERPRVVCFIGKIAYQKFAGVKDVAFGWLGTLHDARLFVMHFPLRGAALVRVEELREIAAAAGLR